MQVVIHKNETERVSFSKIPVGRAFKIAISNTEPAYCYWKVAKNCALGLKSGAIYETPAYFAGVYEILPEGSVTITI